MEALAVLEKKIADLVEVISALRVENGQLVNENQQLREKVEQLETFSLTHRREDESAREATRTMIDNLIKDIDAVIAHEQTS